MSFVMTCQKVHVIRYDMSKGARASLYADKQRGSGLPMHIDNGMSQCVQYRRFPPHNIMLPVVTVRGLLDD